MIVEDVAVAAVIVTWLALTTAARRPLKRRLGTPLIVVVFIATGIFLATLTAVFVQYSWIATALAITIVAPLIELLDLRNDRFTADNRQARDLASNEPGDDSTG